MHTHTYQTQTRSTGARKPGSGCSFGPQPQYTKCTNTGTMYMHTHMYQTQRQSTGAKRPGNGCSFGPQHTCTHIYTKHINAHIRKYDTHTETTNTYTYMHTHIRQRTHTHIPQRTCTHIYANTYTHIYQTRSTGARGPGSGCSFGPQPCVPLRRCARCQWAKGRACALRFHLPAPLGQLAAGVQITGAAFVVANNCSGG